MFDGLDNPCPDFWRDWPEGFCVLDEIGAMRYVNPAAEELLGYSADELRGVKLNRLLVDGAFCWPVFLETGKTWQQEEAFLRRKNGRELPVYLTLKPFSRNGQIKGAWLLFRDRSATDEKMRRLSILTAAVTQSPNAVMIADLNGKIVYVNPKFCQMTGYSAEEVLGKNPRLLQSGKTPPKTYRRLWETLQKGGEWRGEIQDRKKDGELYWVLETISPIKNEQGEITHFLAIQKDITEQKQAQEALAESEARFRQIADMTGEWIWEQDPEGRYIYSSAAVKQILGYEPEEIIGKHYLDLFTVEDRRRWEQHTPLKPLYHKHFYRIINRYRHKDGHEVFTESTGIPLFDSAGRLLKWRGVDHDVTERKRYEDQLRVRERAIESASVGIDIDEVLDSRWQAIYVNPTLCRMTGYSKEELLKQSIPDLLCGPETDKGALEKVRAEVRQGREAQEVILCYDKKGRPFWNDMIISPVKDEAGRLTHVIEIQNDVTERRRAEAEKHAMEIARHIQQSLLPDQPLIADGVELAGLCIPAEQVGGDYFDYFLTAAGVDAVVADVSGHSVGAALIMAEARSTLRVEVQSRARQEQFPPPDVASLLQTLNNVLFEDLDRSELFITLFYTRYDPVKKQLHYANAGHNHPLLIRSNESGCRQLDAEGLILGVRPGVEFEQKTLSMLPGDLLLLYTDGIVEAQNPAGEFFGMSRLCRAFTRLSAASPSELVQGLIDELYDFHQSDVFYDDISLVAMRVGE
ncbi:MAG: hypothetical protein AXA67_00920 [Methylothermaceae bacteria B42]|nr:MAG: hypothetical protein AXA67_00920 [Methylothermaceae bacteria B42]HHJ39659.1 PAS domain S-box protein [Methylothermaceae bacterium]